MALHRIFHKDKAAVHVVLADDASFNPIALMHLFHGFSPEYDFSTTVDTEANRSGHNRASLAEAQSLDDARVGLVLRAG